MSIEDMEKQESEAWAAYMAAKQSTRRAELALHAALAAEYAFGGSETVARTAAAGGACSLARETENKAWQHAMRVTAEFDTETRNPPTTWYDVKVESGEFREHVFRVEAKDREDAARAGLQASNGHDFSCDCISPRGFKSVVSVVAKDAWRNPRRAV